MHRPQLIRKTTVMVYACPRPGVKVNRSVDNDSNIGRWLGDDVFTLTYGSCSNIISDV